MKIKKIIGVPGAGKTKALLDLFELELRVTAPNRVAFLTFTKAAQQEALGRCGRPQNDLPFLRTIHSICYHQLGIKSDQLVQPRDLRELGERLGVPFGGQTDPWAGEEFGVASSQPTPADQLLQLNHLGRHRCITLKQALAPGFDMDFYKAKWLTQAYRDWRKAESKLDFTDMLTRYLEEGSPLPIDVMFVDEGQDLSKLQWQVVAKMGSTAQRWYICADPDQTIFGWAGAAADLFTSYPADETVYLSRSYRVPRRVMIVAGGILRRIHHREAKKIIPREEDGSVGNVGELYHELRPGSGTSLILFRNHYRGRALAAELVEAGIPFAGSHAALSRSATRAAAMAWYHVDKGEELRADEVRALIRNLGSSWVTGVTPIRGKKLSAAAVMRRIPTREQWPALLSGVPGIEYVDQVVRHHGWDELLSPRTQLMSIHQAKGRQADRVILDLSMAERTFEGMDLEPDEEHRVWYVAVTRTFRDLRLLRTDAFRSYEL